MIDSEYTTPLPLLQAIYLLQRIINSVRNLIASAHRRKTPLLNPGMWDEIGNNCEKGSVSPFSAGLYILSSIGSMT